MIVIGGTQAHQSIRSDGICPCLTSSMGMGGGYVPIIIYIQKMENKPKRLFNLYNDNYGTGFAGNVWDKEAISPNLMTMQGGNREPLIMENEQKVRIRKLTPKECWRLMGFDDEDFSKAKEVNSDSQLYKQAGNSIVVNVLMAIFKEML